MYKNRHFLLQGILMTALLLAILLQGLTHRIPMKPLNGFTDVLQPETLSFKTYYDGSYQNYLTQYAKLNTGFREPLIRSYNQFAFSCLDKITNNTIVKGSNNELFLNSYLEEYQGQTLANKFGTVDNAKVFAQQQLEETLKFIQILEAHGTRFLFVFCPTKPFLYHERLPNWYQHHAADFSLEEYFIELFKENNIPIIDFYHYFKEIKDDFPYPLMSKTGSHWSESTIPFVGDSIYRKIEALTGNRLPTMEIVDQNISTNYSVIDGELEANLNLLFPLRKEAIPNPVCTLSDTVGKDRPNLIVIGDSFFNLLRRSVFVNAFNHWDYWVYNKYIHSSRDFYNGRQTNMVFDAAEMLEEADIVIAMFTSIFLPDYLFGFVPMASELLTNGNPPDEVYIDQIIESIKNDPEWYESIKKQSKENGITLEEGLRNNAGYVLWNYRQTPH